MGFAFFYFTAKLLLFLRGYIRLDLGWNLLFMGYLFLAAFLAARYPGRKAVKVPLFIVSLAAGFFLFWHDTWFPSPGQTYALLKAHGLPTAEYILDFSSRFYSPVELGAAAGLLALSFFVRKYKRALGVILPLLLAAAFFWAPSSKADGEELDSYLRTFYEAEASRIVHFKRPQVEKPLFDIIVISVCSVAWDDLKLTGLDKHPLLRRFDYLFDDFNSVSSYSNPSVIRLLNANAGQARHADMYKGYSKGSALFEGLKGAGYETYYAMNHDGVYGHFLDQTRQLGSMTGKVLIPSGLGYKVKMFDGSPVYGDYDTLKYAWEVRQKSAAPKAAVFYNTATLHDGCHHVQDGERWKKDPAGAYHALLKGLLDDLDKYLDLVEASGRNAVIVFVPEHGRALRGGAMQVSGLRDIPLPNITHVPAGVKLAGKRTYPYTFRQLNISPPSSFLALSYMLSIFVENNPFSARGFDSEGFINGIPRTEFVSENEENTVVRKSGRYFLRGKGEKWLAIPAE